MSHSMTVALFIVIMVVRYLQELAFPNAQLENMQQMLGIKHPYPSSSS